ncbi:MAG: Hsp70 family protein, partial [Nannocystaceae bacterium]
HKFLAHDPESVRGEFKRLMGTRKGLSLAENTRRPEELSAEILRALRRDVETQHGVAPDRAVVTVPALFELPQIAATREAARLAGFTEVEMLQEPVASALAAGFRTDQQHGHWLVYDLGGGTFDVSLLAARDGFVDVIGHDGDNFLGGRDLDWAMVAWACEQIEREHAVVLSRANSAHTPTLNKLKRALEDAKIELSQVEDTFVMVPDLIPHPDGTRHLELTISRDDLARICAPVLERTVEVCRRLLKTGRVNAEQVERLVLVGGPAAMPTLRQHVSHALGIELATGHDPMTLVARGAALFAASAGLDARPQQAPSKTAHKLWLRHPAVSSDLHPHVVGRVTDCDRQGAPSKIRLVRNDGNWQGEWVGLNQESGFISTTQLVPRRTNHFTIEAQDDAGNPVEVSPPDLTIVQGMSLSDPPLS